MKVRCWRRKREIIYHQNTYWRSFIVSTFWRKWEGRGHTHLLLSKKTGEETRDRETHCCGRWLRSKFRFVVKSWGQRVKGLSWDFQIKIPPKQCVTTTFNVTTSYYFIVLYRTRSFNTAALSTHSQDYVEFRMIFLSHVGSDCDYWMRSRDIWLHNLKCDSAWVLLISSCQWKFWLIRKKETGYIVR